ncbi:FAD-binding protein [Microbacterium sp. JZ101]
MSMERTDDEGPWDLIVVGHGFAGLSAAVAYLEARHGATPRVAVIDRARPDERGGSTRWAPASFRATDVSAALSETLGWLTSNGVGLRPFPGFAPWRTTGDWRSLVGEGRGFVERYHDRATRLGARFFYQTELLGLGRGAGGAVARVEVRGADREMAMDTTAVVLASGGFEGDREELARRVPGGERLEPASPGARLSTGAGLAAATAIGAARTSRPDTAALLPVDPRSDRVAPIVGTWLRGILVDLDGRRFLDEGEGTFESHADTVARAVLARGGLAFAITDATVRAATPASAALQRTDQPPISADSIAELADRLGMDAAVLGRTVEQYNAATPAALHDGSPLDGNRTTGASPKKSSWALPLIQPPFEALPVGAQVAFTTEGLRVDDAARVLDAQGDVIPGLYAAGAIAGSFPDHARPTDGSFLHAILSGRLAGTAAAAQCP